MSKKLHSKLLSVILCIAICCATLCGSLIAAHAAAADYKGTYTISVGDDKQAVPFAATEVKAQVKFDLPAGFVGGQFTAKAQSNYTIGDEVSAVAATKKDGTALTADELATVEFVTRASGSDKDIRFVIGDGVLCTSVTIEYTLVFTGTNYSTESTDRNGIPVSIDVDGANFGVNGDYADVTFSGSDSAFHSHAAWFDPNSIKGLNEDGTLFPNGYAGEYVTVENEKNGKHTVASAACPFCERVANTLFTDSKDKELYKRNIQIFPDITEFDGKTTLKTATGWCGISGVTVNYNDNGSLDVNVHVYSQWRSNTVDLLICDTEGNELYRLPCVADGTSYFAGNGFPTAEKMFTITGLSARDIDTELLLTIAEYGDGANLWLSRTMPFCLADYCQNVVEENGAIWVDGATSEQIEADKDVAAALYYYGASIDESVFDKNTSTGSSIEYVNANYDEWDGTRTEPTETDSEGNIIIRNAEQLAWIALEGSTATNDINYKVVANSVFNMKGMDGITLNSTAADIKAASKKWQMRWVPYVDGTATDTANVTFGGNFDGNGLTVYNISGGAGGGVCYQGLFPVLKQSANGVTQEIKNVQIVASYFVGYHNAGALIGSVPSAPGTDCKLNIENISVKNCYITDNANTNAACSRTVGVIAGNVGHNKTTVNNCFALNNELVATNIYGGLIANTSQWSSGLVINNSVIIGTPKAPIDILDDGKNIETPAANATYTNVHTDDVAAATLGSAWFDTTTYPELSIFHKLSKQYVDENTHKVICVLKAGDNTCDLKGLTEEHTLVANDEGTAEVCECGYSKKIIGNAVVPNNKITVAWGTGYNANRPTTLEASGMTGSGAENDPYIIKTPAQLYYVTQRAGAASAGKYYKVSDEIAVFDLSPDASGWNLADNSCNFQGNFDGNGVELINFKGTGYHSALFPNVSGTVTIKNLKINGAVIEPSGSNGAAIIASINGDTTTNVTVSQCVIVDTVVSAKGQAGAIVATAGNGPHLTINNCMVYNTTVTTTSTQSYDPGNCVLGLSWAADNCSISDSIILGLNPENRINNISNVYTDYSSATNANITKITDLNTLKGSGVVKNLNLDNDVWFDTDSYPELSAFHDMITVYIDEDTHKDVCQVYVDGVQCATCSVSAKHILVENAEDKKNECSCGYYEDIIGNSINPNNKTKVVWDGAMPKTLDAAAFTKGSGAIDDPYIITKPSQLWYIAQIANADSAGKYYEIDDSIGVFDLNSINWGLSDNSCNFQGNFDGNGVELINFKGASWHSALFPNVSGTVTIKNLKIKGAVVEPSGSNGGVLIASINGDANTNVTVSQCVVADSIVSAKGQAGAIVATAGNGPHLTINNCMVYNTTVTTTSTQSYDPGNCVLGLSWAADNCSMSDSIILGLNPENRINNISNVYTDYSSATNANITKITDLNTLKGSGVVENLNLDNGVWFDTDSYPELSVFHDMVTIYVDANTHQTVCQHFINGTQCTTCQAVTSHTMVDAEDGKSASCECGYSYEIKGIHAMNLPESILNRITSNELYIERFATNALFKSAYNEDVYGTQVQENVFDMYATSLNLKVNPHIAFTFAFHGDYKTNKANITATFSVEGQVIATVTGAEMINNAGAGRYHLYRFKALPVSKLCKDITVTVNYGGSDYDFGTYSAAGYAINAMNAGEGYQEHVNASMALVYYSEMLAARQGK